MLQYMDTFSPRPAAENITNWFPMQFKRQKKQSITERCCQSCQIFPVLPATHHLETRIPEPRRPSYMVPACKTPITIFPDSSCQLLLAKEMMEIAKRTGGTAGTLLQTARLQHLLHPPAKPRTLIIDFRRRKPEIHESVHIEGSEVERVSNFKLPNLTPQHTSAIIKKALL
ncbi:uncharacterized protein LOC132402980 isoform X2 [Hypanus sabinus]|uniref:uncharacterized protein LOC132402980 isoform X2 n=1 Tax=Hypanus sabinus TaxID=79690 RepID=UPI0028C45B7C|nr:uncharacterized protein LOC132402980 isoform X2 [Hypanus sabinus]